MNFPCKRIFLYIDKSKEAFMSNKKIGVIGIEGAWSTEMLAETVKKRTGFVRIIDIEKLSVDLDSGTALFNGEDIAGYDALIIKKIGRDYSPSMLDRLEMLRFLNERGLKIFSKPARIINVLNRLTCTVTLKNGSIPVPDTAVTEDVDEACDIVKKYKKAVFKPLYTSKARGMTIIDDGVNVHDEIEKYKKSNSLMYIQRIMDIGEKDLGLVFVGGEYLATYARVKNKGSWNTTTNSGGSYMIHTPSEDIIKLAQKAQDIFKLDFTCVDIAETDAGPVVFEVSAFGGFKGIYESSGIEAAEVYLNYVLKELKNGKKS
jgi:ribosomal protein S6--L-glutamate ligase